MPNTNFQTIFQMKQAINDMVKQATGRDVVQAIEMGQVTVAQNHISTEHTYSGDVVSFVTNDEYPMQIGVDINPVQDLHGYDYPWPAGGGKNLLNYSVANVSTNNTNFNNGITLKANQAYTFSYYGNSNVTIIAYYHGTSDRLFASGYVNTYTYTPTEDVEIDIAFYNSSGVTSAENLFQLEIGSTSTSWTPYSNICQITGWTGAEITVANGDDPTAQGYEAETYTITFPEEAGTVYGGKLTVNKDGTGTLVIEWANIASYDGEELPGVWISDRDVYAEGTTPTTGAQVVYELAEPVTVTLEAEEITTLTGENNVWSDTGDITVSYDEITEGGGV